MTFLLENSTCFVLVSSVMMMIMFWFYRRYRWDHEPDLSPEEFANYKYQSSSATNLLPQEHIEAIALRQWKKVMAWVAFHSDQVPRLEDIKGQTILHHAALFRAPADVMEFLLWAAPQLAFVPNKDGELALHWAVRLSTPSPVLTLLLEAYPESAFLPDGDGSTPLALLWERHQISLLRTWRTERHRLWDESDSVWRRIMCVYRALQKNTTSTNTNHHSIQEQFGAGSSYPPFTPIHLAAAHPSPPCLFPLMIQVYKQQLQERDSNGQLALAIACESPMANRSFDVLTKIQLLLREYPEAASMIDPKHRQYPLLIALASGVLWNDGIESLIQASPMTLSIRDSSTGLFPFALAALPKTKTKQEIMDADSTVMECLELDTIYNTLRADPSVLKLCGF